MLIRVLLVLCLVYINYVTARDYVLAKMKEKEKEAYRKSLEDFKRGIREGESKEPEIKISDNSDWFVVYESPTEDLPVFSTNSGNNIDNLAKQYNIKDPFVVKTTLGEHRKHLEEIMTTQMMSMLDDNDDDWDEELFGDAPE